MDDELSPVEQLRKELEEAKDDDGGAPKPAKKRSTNVSKKAPAKKAVKATKPAGKPRRIAKKPNAKKKAEAKPAPAKKAPAKKAPAKKAPVKASKPPSDSKREMVRDRKGDGLTPVERKIIAFVSDSEEPVSVVTIGRRMFGADCPSEGDNSFRTVRNGLRFPIKYGMVDQVKVKGETKRGLYKIGAAYKRSKGNLDRLAERYRARVAKEREAS